MQFDEHCFHAKYEHWLRNWYMTETRLNQCQELVRMQEKIHLRKTEWPSWELSLHMFLGQLKHSHNFVSFLNRINDDDNLRLSI